MNRLGKPQDCDTNDSDAFYQGSNGVGDRGSGREDDESDDVLGKVDGAVEEEIVHDRMGRCSTNFIVASEVGVVFGGIICGHEDWEVVVEPNGDHEDECHAGGIEQEIQFIEFMRRRLSS